MLKGSMTVELLSIMPVFFLVFLVTIYSTFYYHDKNIIYGAAHETVAVCGVMNRRASGVNERDVTALFEQRIHGKCILFPGASATASVNEDEIRLEVQAVKKRMHIRTEAVCPLTKPEETIRKIRLLKGAGTK